MYFTYLPLLSLNYILSKINRVSNNIFFFTIIINYSETESETEIIPSLFRDGNRDRIISVSNQRRKFRSLFPSLNRDGIISVSNLGRKSFRLYLETEIETELSVSNQRRIFSVSD